MTGWLFNIKLNSTKECLYGGNMESEFKVSFFGKEYTFEGITDGEILSVSNQRYAKQWYTNSEEVPYQIFALCKNGDVLTITLTEDAYNRYIIPLKPSVESPFSYNMADEKYGK